MIPSRFAILNSWHSLKFSNQNCFRPGTALESVTVCCWHMSAQPRQPPQVCCCWFLNDERLTGNNRQPRPLIGPERSRDQITGL